MNRQDLDRHIFVIYAPQVMCMTHWLIGTKPETQARTEQTLNTLSQERGGAPVNFIAKIRAKDPAAWDAHRARIKARNKIWRESAIGRSKLAARHKRLADGVSPTTTTTSLSLSVSFLSLRPCPSLLSHSFSAEGIASLQWFPLSLNLTRLQREPTSSD